MVWCAQSRTGSPRRHATAIERLDQATQAVSVGDYLRARPHELVRPIPGGQPSERAPRQEERAPLSLRSMPTLSNFSIDARFDCRFGSLAEKERGRQTCTRVLALYDQIENQSGVAVAGLPPLNMVQLERFKEDVFEAFLVAALVEQELATGQDARQAAAREAVEWLTRAEKVLPGTRAIFVQRAACWGVIGNKQADEADRKRAQSIAPTSAVDRFWHGAHHLRGEDAQSKGDTKAAQDFFHKEVASTRLS